MKTMGKEGIETIAIDPLDYMYLRLPSPPAVEVQVMQVMTRSSGGEVSLIHDISTNNYGHMASVVGTTSKIAASRLLIIEAVRCYDD